jgi:hypothetical protein
LTIAHRLTSIKNAKNLLCIEGRDKICSYCKDTSEYDEALARLKNLTQPFGDGEEEEEEQGKIEIMRSNSIMMRSESMSMRKSERDQPQSSTKKKEAIDSSALYQTAKNTHLTISTGLENAIL